MSRLLIGQFLLDHSSRQPRPDREDMVPFVPGQRDDSLEFDCIIRRSPTYSVISQSNSMQIKADYAA